MSENKNDVKQDPVLEAMEDIAKSMEVTKGAIDSRVTAVDAKVEKASKELDEKIETSMKFVADKIDLLTKRQFTYGRLTSEPMDDLMSAIPEGKRSLIPAIRAQIGKRYDPYTGEAKAADGPMSNPLVAAVSTLWFQAAMKAQLPKSYGREQSAALADMERYETALGQVFGKAELSEGADASGGYLVPDIIGSQILRIAQDSSVVFSRGRHVPMTSNRLELPNEATGVTINFVDEGGTMTEGGPAFGINILTAKKLVGRATASMEVVEDSIVGLLPYLQTVFGEKIGRTLDGEALEGSGTNFTGVTAASGVNTVGSNTTGAAITYAALVQIMFAAGEESTRQGAAWFMNPQLFASVVGLVDSNGQPIFQYANVQGSPYPTLLGKPVFNTNVLSVAGTATGGETDNLGTIYFGDPMTLIWGDRSGLRFDVSEAPNWGTGKIDMRIIIREGFTVGTPAAWTKGVKYVKLGG
jgi:HK97 family phage major capsid protein